MTKFLSTEQKIKTVIWKETNFSIFLNQFKSQNRDRKDAEQAKAVAQEPSAVKSDGKYDSGSEMTMTIVQWHLSHHKALNGWKLNQECDWFWKQSRQCIIIVIVESSSNVEIKKANE